MYPKLVFVLYQESCSPCAEDVVRGVTEDENLAKLWAKHHENWYSIEEVITSEGRIKELIWGDKLKLEEE